MLELLESLELDLELLALLADESELLELDLELLELDFEELELLDCELEEDGAGVGSGRGTEGLTDT